MMRRYSALLVAVFVFGCGSSLAWEVLSDIPDTVEAGQSIVLDIVTWIPNTECYACRGHEVEYGDLSADVFVITERTQPWAYDCNGYETSCYYTIEVVFQEVGLHVLRLNSRFIAPAFGGDTLMSEHPIEVQEPVSTSGATWGALKATYR